MNGQQIDSNYWMWHFFWVAIWAILPIAYGLHLLFSAIGWGWITATGFLIGIGGTAILAAWGALFGYWVEAKRFEEAGSDWVPSKWFYIIFHIFTTPAIVAPIYFIQRWRHSDIPWSDLKVWA